MRPSLARAVARLTALALVAGAAVVAAPGPPAAEAASDGGITFTGRGYGHGRGMGQWGALGYAVDHGWSAEQILGHYYQGTSLARDAGNPTIGVEIGAFTGKETLVSGRNLTLNGTPVSAGALRFGLGPDSTLLVFTGTGCASDWTLLGTYPSGAVVGTTASDADPTNLLRLCGTGVNGPDTAYRGTIRAVVSGRTQYTVNQVPMQSYLRGVVPHEMSASWGGLGGGRGQQALMAQAVAARSYALAPRGARASGATTCDSTACQVYLGAATVTRANGVTSLEYASADKAVADTSGWVMRAGGRIALTEYSASTGGYTAGGAFAAVPDDGDDYAGNPNRSWTVTISSADVAAKLGTGSVASVAVASRNGLGADGGRVTGVRVTTTSGSVVQLTGDQVRSRLGLKSDWFTVSGMTTGQAQAMVKALYADLLGRSVDPSGLQTWTNELLAGREPAVVVDTLTRSGEYRRMRITQAYQDVFGRAPDAGGLDMWLKEVASGRVGIDDVKRRLLDSGEFFSRSGGTARGYVDRLYQSVLKREATAAELDSWSQRFQALGRSGVATAIWGSKESAMRRVEVYYPMLFGRTVDRGGLETWANQLLRAGEAAVRNGLAASGEYRSRSLARFPS